MCEDDDDADDGTTGTRFHIGYDRSNSNNNNNNNNNDASFQDHLSPTNCNIIITEITMQKSKDIG